MINVTVPRAHHPVNTAALAAGLPVLCEKPLAESVAECLSMVAAAELSGQLLMVSQSRRYWRAVTALRAQLAELGPVASASCQFFKAPHFGGFREEMAYPLLVDMAIHQFDLARLLIGRRADVGVLPVLQPRLELVRGRRGRLGDLRVRRPGDLHLRRQLVRPRGRDLLERCLAFRHGAGDRDLGR